MNLAHKNLSVHSSRCTQGIHVYIHLPVQVGREKSRRNVTVDMHHTIVIQKSIKNQKQQRVSEVKIFLASVYLVWRTLVNLVSISVFGMT